MPKLFATIFFILLVLGAWMVFHPGTSSVAEVATTPSVSQKLKVVASFYPVGFFAQEIGGDLAEVEILTPAGSEPHEYEPTAAQMADIQNADVVVVSGTIEAWAAKAPEFIDARHTTLVRAAAGLESLFRTEEGHSSADPHVWLSPVLAGKMVAAIEAGFIQTDPANADYYETRAELLATRLAALDAEFRLGLSQCAQRSFFTSHAAFGYLASQYGLTQVAIAGLSPETEPSVKQLADIVTQVKATKATTVFFEPLVSSELAMTVAAEAGVKVAVLDPLEGLADAGQRDHLGRTIDYFSIMDNNLRALQSALICTP